MEITDDEIRRIQTLAMLNQGIEACQKTLGEMILLEADIREKRMRFEIMLGQLIAQKMVLETVRKP
jgi:hypothetical protein